MGFFGSGWSGNELTVSASRGEASLFCQMAKRKVGTVWESIRVQIMVSFPNKRLSKFVTPYGPD